MSTPYDVVSVRYDVYGTQFVTIDDGREVIVHDDIVCRNDQVIFDPVMGQWRLYHES